LEHNRPSVRIERIGIGGVMKSNTKMLSIKMLSVFLFINNSPSLVKVALILAKCLVLINHLNKCGLLKKHQLLTLTKLKTLFQ